jgi:hypothetical protein
MGSSANTTPGSGKRPDVVATRYTSFVLYFYTTYIIVPGLEAADNKSEPNLQPISVLRSSTRKFISHWLTIRREMVIFNNQTASRLDGDANHLVQKLADSMASFLTWPSLLFMIIIDYRRCYLVILTTDKTKA